MKKTIVLMASPRLQSNTDILTQKVMDGLKAAGAQAESIEKFDLVEYSDFVCCACGQCRAAGTCLQFPEVAEVLEKIEAADSLVIATPTWWLAGSSYLKIFMDHWGAYLRPDYSSRIAGKKAVIVSVCGNPEMNMAEKVCEDLAAMLSFLQVDVVGTLGVKGVAEVGAVEREADALQQAFELGEKLHTA